MIIISWNIKGFGGSNRKRKRGRMCQEIHKRVIGGTGDILLIQEHRLSTEKITSFGSPLQGDWVTLWGHGYGSEENVGGVCISLRGR